jgi:hypothetical protein
MKFIIAFLLATLVSVPQTLAGEAVLVKKYGNEIHGAWGKETKLSEDSTLIEGSSRQYRYWLQRQEELAKEKEEREKHRKGRRSIERNFHSSGKVRWGTETTYSQSHARTVQPGKYRTKRVKGGKIKTFPMSRIKVFTPSSPKKRRIGR